MSVIKKLMPEKIPAFGAVFYNLLPAKIFVPHYKIIAEEIHLKEYGVLLDIGTGPGVLPINIAARFPHSKIIGIDLSDKMIEIANKNKNNKGLDNVEFRVMDANALKLNDNSLDMVISTGSLHHWKNPVRILNEIYRCLKFGCEAWIYDGYAEAADADIEKHTAKLFCGFPPRGLIRRVLSLHGFSQKEYDTEIKDMVARTKFTTCLFEKHGIMMCLKFRKS